MKRLLLIMFVCGVVGSSIVYGEPRQIDLDTMSKEELMELADEISNKLSEIESTESITEESEKKYSVWFEKYYVDNFGDPTDKPYVTTFPIKGYFSNTATNKSSLKVKLLFDETANIQLLEYDELPVQGYYSKGETYFLYYREEDGTKGFLTGELEYGSDRVSFNARKSLELYELMCRNDSLSIIILAGVVNSSDGVG